MRPERGLNPSFPGSPGSIPMPVTPTFHLRAKCLHQRAGTAWSPHPAGLTGVSHSPSPAVCSPPASAHLCLSRSHPLREGHHGCFGGWCLTRLSPPRRPAQQLVWLKLLPRQTSDPPTSRHHHNRRRPRNSALSSSLLSQAYSRSSLLPPMSHFPISRAIFFKTRSGIASLLRAESFGGFLSLPQISNLKPIHSLATVPNALLVQRSALSH